jgi:hypothetical protein
MHRLRLNSRPRLGPYGPFQEIDREAAFDLADDPKAGRHLFTITSDQVFIGEDDTPTPMWIGYSGIRLVNAYLFFRARRRLPKGMRVLNVTLENGQPKLAGADGWPCE